MRHLGFSIEHIKSHFENMDYEHALQLFEKVLLEIKTLKNIDNFEISNNFTPVLRRG